jgi:hypothetical protein
METRDHLPEPGTVGETREPYNLLSNTYFENGDLYPWQKSFGSLSGANQGQIKLEHNIHGYDVVFTPSGNEEKDHELQLLQRGLNLKYGYSYKLSFEGMTTKSGNASVLFALLNCTTDSKCDPYKTWTKSFVFTYTLYNDEESWDNCSFKDSNATFVISGGLAKVEFKIAVIKIKAEPISCP